MVSDDEKSEDEEEILVYAEFEGLVDSNVFGEEQLQLDMIGIDTEHPIMQINGRFYEGTYEDVLGTYMFFTKDDNAPVEDSVFDATSNLKYFAKTRKFLRMQRIFIKSRAEVLGDSENDQCIPNLNTLKQAGVPLRYKEEALSFWKTMRNNRLNALHLYLEKQKIRQQKKSQGIMLDSESDEDHPFAMYKHKHKQEESNNTKKSEDNVVGLKKESRNGDTEFHLKVTDPKKTVLETSDVIKDSCRNSLEQLPTLEPKPCASNDSSNSVKSIKTFKTKVSGKKSANMVPKVQKTKNKTKRIVVKGKNILSGTEEKEMSSIEENLPEWDKCDVIENLNSVEIAKDESKTIHDGNEIPAIQKTKEKTNETDATGGKITKQLKREAKMKEISEQLKAIAEEHLNKKVT